MQQVLVNWKNILGNATTMNSGFIVLEHDLFPQAVEAATGYILPDAIAHQPPFKIEPVITCLNKPLRDAYVETNDNKTNPPVASGEFFHSHRPPEGGPGGNVSIGFDPYMRLMGLAFGEGDQGDTEAYQHHLGDAGLRVDTAVQPRDEVGHGYV